MLSPNTINYKARLIHLITGINEEDLKRATYTSQELRVSNKQDKVYKTDIIVTIKNHIISLEMNKDYYKGLNEKNEMYQSKILSDELDQGDDYLDLKGVIQINIDDFHLYKGNKIIHEFMLMEKDTKEIGNEYYKSYHIDLKSVDEIDYNKNEINKMLMIFKECNLEKLRGDKIMDEALDELERISSDEKIIGLYDKEKVEKKILNTRLRGAKEEGLEEGKKEGLEQGKKEGLEEGKKEGLEEGKRNIAKNLLKLKIKEEDILVATGLSREELEKLK